MVKNEITKIKPRKKKVPVPESQKDLKYRERRRKNTIYARKSREKKRQLDLQNKFLIEDLIKKNNELKKTIEILNNKLEEMEKNTIFKSTNNYFIFDDLYNQNFL